MLNSHAIEQTTQDLIDCLLAEEFFNPLTLLTPQYFQSIYTTLGSIFPSDNTQAIWKWDFDTQATRSIIVALQPAITQKWRRVPNTPIYLCDGNQIVEELSPQSFLEHTFYGLNEKYKDCVKGSNLFKEVLNISVHQAKLSLEHRVESQDLLKKDNAGFFLAMEQWASFRDRPYHPLAKAKHGLSDADYRAYQAEFNVPVNLNWVAVRKDWLQTGADIQELEQQQPSRYLLPSEQQSVLAQELNDKGLSDSHIALPVHPWQYQNVLEQQIAEHFTNGACQRLEFTSDDFFATSSLRSMTPCFASCDHLKLPMAVYSLGASRYLPAVKMINGGFSEILLQQAKKCDPILESKLHLCEEGKWWAFMPPEATLFDEAPRHLSAMVRSYPSSLIEQPDTRIFPMAALGSPLPEKRDHFFDEWISYRGLNRSENSVTTLFSELCSSFFEVNLRMFKLGMIGEVHGQNAVLVWEKGHITGLLLRDHDSLRICVPVLEQNNLNDPNYCIKPGHANTLYHNDPEALLFWLQTLGIQVNMRSIIETLSLIYDIDEFKLWEVMEQEIRQLISHIVFPSDIEFLIVSTLFEKEVWPQKHLLSPMIDRAGGPGSMPFGKGDIVNPFRQAKTLRLETRKRYAATI